MANELEQSFVETLKRSELSSLATDWADALADMPLFGSLIKLWRGAGSVHSYIYTKKVVAFLTELGAIPLQKRQEQISKLLVVPGEQEKFGEHIVFLLDRMNEVDKAKLMGKIARAFLEERITLDEMKSLNFALDSFDLRLIDRLKAANRVTRSNTNEDQLLAQCGLMVTCLFTDVLAPPSTPRAAKLSRNHPLTPDIPQTVRSVELCYSISDLGKLFVKICLE